MKYLYKGKPVKFVRLTYVYQDKQYCTIELLNYLRHWQRQSVQFGKLVVKDDPA